VSQIIKDQDLNYCECGGVPEIKDDCMSLKIVCVDCKKSTDEYLYGAGSYCLVRDDIIEDWNTNNNNP
jgi:hypothetical protein